jgi:hypothetical protein
LLANPIGQAIALLAQILGHARPLAQLDHRGIIDGHEAEGASIGAQAVGQHKRVAAVVLGSGHREPITKPVELLGVDREHREPALKQGFHDRPMRRLDRDADARGRRAAPRDEPIAEFAQLRAAMSDLALPDRLPDPIQQAGDMGLVRPIKTNKPFDILGHGPSPSLSGRHDSGRSLYWRSKRDLLADLKSRPTREGACPSQGLEAQGNLGCSSRADPNRSAYKQQGVSDIVTGTGRR